MASFSSLYQSWLLLCFWTPSWISSWLCSKIRNKGNQYFYVLELICQMITQLTVIIEINKRTDLQVNKIRSHCFTDSFQIMLRASYRDFG